MGKRKYKASSPGSIAGWVIFIVIICTGLAVCGLWLSGVLFKPTQSKLCPGVANVAKLWKYDDDDKT